jgi:hypothetical protein
MPADKAPDNSAVKRRDGDKQDRVYVLAGT